MVDPLDTEEVDAVADVVHRIRLVDIAVRRQAIVARPRRFEHRLEQRREPRGLVVVEADPDDVGPVGVQVAQDGQRILRRVITLETHDELRTNANLSGCVATGLGDGLYTRPGGHALTDSLLWIEHHLHVSHALVSAPREEGECHLVIVGRGAERPSTDVERFEETDQVLLAVGPMVGLVVGDVAGGRVRKLDTVALGDREEGLWLEGPLDVHVELDLRHRRDELSVVEVGADRIAHLDSVAASRPAGQAARLAIGQTLTLMG